MAFFSSVLWVYSPGQTNQYCTGQEDGGEEPTCSQENDVKEHVFALHHIHGHVSEAHAVLHEVRDGVHRLDHLVHEQELLSVLQVPLGQVHVGARVDGSALWRTSG